MSARTFLKTLAVLTATLAVGTGTANAALVYGIQASTGQILTIDPATGMVVNSFATPQAIPAADQFAGLTFANQLNELLYYNLSVSQTLFRLNPSTGVVMATATGDPFNNVGLSYQQIGGTNFLYYADGGVDVHRQTGFNGPTAFFFGPLSPDAGLGGDGYGREFAIDGTLIREYNINTGATIGAGFAAPVGARGLAFDGTNLYVSTTGGLLLTLNPTTGAVLNSVTVAGGTLIELGANAVGGGPPGAVVPEPASIALLGIGAAGLVGYVRRRKAAVTA